MRAGMNAWFAVLIGFAVGALFGLFNGLLVTKLRIPAFIATFGSMDSDPKKAVIPHLPKSKRASQA